MEFKGIVTDVRPAEQPEGTVRWAKNKVNTRKAKSLADEMPISVEPIARDFGITSQEEEVFIGKIQLDQDDTAIFSAVYFEEDTRTIKSSRIYILHADGTQTPVIDDPLLGFEENTIIDGITIKNYNGTRSVIFTDNLNPVRMLNLDEPEVQLNDEGAFVNPKEISLLNYFMQVEIPNVSNLMVEDAGGSLLSGVYYYAICYQVGENGTTNYMPVSNPVPITDSKRYGGYSNYDGCEPGTVTGKSVTIEYEGLDTNFDRFNLGIIKRVKGQVSCEMIAGGLIDEFGKGKITHTGNETAQPILLEDIIINNADYKTAKTLTFNDNKVYMANLTTEDYEGQAEANDIQVDWVFDEDISVDGSGGSFKDGSVCFSSKSFMPGEVYAFYISWLKKAGGYTPAYLISGRESKDMTFEGQTIHETDKIKDVQTAVGAAASYLDEDLLINDDAKFFQTRETASVDGTVSDTAKTVTEVVGGYGTMGYWENEELYPEQFPGLAGLPVRHHRFPTLNTLSNAGLLHSVIDGQDPGLEIEEFEIGAHTETVDLLELEENKLVYDIPADTGSLTTVSMVSGTTHENGKVLEITFNKKCEVEYDFLADITGCNVIRSFLIGWFPKKNKSKLHMSLYAEGHGDQFSPINVEESTNWYSYYNVLDVRAKKQMGKYIIMRKGDKIKLDISADRGIHHVNDFNFKFRVKQWSVSDHGYEGSVFTNSLGIKLSNIKVPKAIEDKVAGFQIFYAKRTLQNSTVYGMGQPAEYLSTDLIPAGGASDFRIHPADLMVNDGFPSVALTHVRHEVNLETEKLEANQAYSKVDQENILYRVQEYKYEPHNAGTESEALFHYTLTGPTNAWTHGQLVSLMGYKTNLYSVYYDQPLVSTGPVFYKDRETIEKLYGGDTYINSYAVRITNETNDKIVQHMVWSAAHIGYRHEGDQWGEMYYPKHNIPGEFGITPEGVTSDKVNNYIQVNPDYSSLNDFNQVYPDNVTRTRINEFFNRVIASTTFHIEGEAAMMRRVLPGDYYELTKDKGEITNLEALGGDLLIHTEHALFKTVSRTELDSSEISVTVGTGNLFRMPPQEVYFDKQGIAGTLHQSSSELLNGHYMFVDEREGQIFKLRQSLDSLSANGNQLMFRDKMKFEIQDQLRGYGGYELKADYPHSKLGLGYSFGYDHEFKRYLLTKRDFKITDMGKVVTGDPIKYDQADILADVTYAGYRYELTVAYDNALSLYDLVVIPSGDPFTEYVVEEVESLGGNLFKIICEPTPHSSAMPGPSSNYTITVKGQEWQDESKIYYHEGLLYDFRGRLLDRDFEGIEDCSITWSFSPDGFLISEHSHTPGMYMSNKSVLRSTAGSKIYRHNSYLNPIAADSYVDIVSTYGRLSRTASVMIDSQKFNSDEVLVPKGEFDAIRVFNDTQCSLEEDITGSKGRTGLLVHNKFMDHVGDEIDFIEDNQINDNKLNSQEPKRFFSTFIIKRLINRNIAENFVLLYNAKAKEIPL